MRLIIAGSRDFNDYGFVKDILDYYLQNTDKHTVAVISGTQRGVDSLGERYAKENGIKVERFPPDWDTHGKAAGPIRNQQMADAATHCIVFTSGGPGSKSMIEIAIKAQLPTKIVRV